MEEEDVSRAELARRLGTSQAYVTKVLRGNVHFALAALGKLARAVGGEVRLDLGQAAARTAPPAAPLCRCSSSRVVPVRAERRRPRGSVRRRLGFDLGFFNGRISMRTKPILMLTGLAALSALPALAPAEAQTAPLASVETNWNGVSIDLVSVERKGSVLTVKWAVRNAAGETANVMFGLTGQQVTTYVVDEESGTKYYALTDKEGHLVASQHEYIGGGTYGISEGIPPAESRRYWMKLPAPPPAVKSLTVFFSNAEPLEEVPITDK
jgi:hypothetical protein